MSVLNPNSDDEPQECPLCMEYLELDDINFYPCSCGYQICRFCWNKIRTEGSGLCPACRSPYAENPADFKPLTAEELAKIKEEKRKKDQAKKQKISENRKHLANVRVVQRNLVFVVGLSPRLADQDVLRKAEYFGKFGRIHKVVINQNTSYAGNQTQGPSASAYVTYFRSEDALRAIQAVNNIFIDNRTLKASLGTTKYCSHFMKNQTCPKHDCMYLHELGDEAASFTKEEMQQGKHTEYEKNLHEELMAATAAAEIAESAESSSPISNGTLGHASGKEPKTSRTPSPKVAGSAGVGWPNLSSASSSSTLTSNSSGGIRVGGSNINNNFRSEPPEREPTPNQLSNHRRDSGSAPLHHLFGNHLGHTIGSQSASTTPTTTAVLSSSLGPCPDSPGTDRSAAQTPNHDLIDDEPEPVVVNNCDSNQWSNLLSNDDLFGEDDLGFDPFHETQKALAEMIESESKQHFEALQMLGGGGGLSNGTIQPSSSSGSSTINRPKQPPPGFSLLNLTGMHQPAVPNLLSHELHNLAGGLDNFSNSGHHHLPPMNHFNDFASNGYGRPQQPHTNHHGHHPFVTSPTENHLGPQLRHQQQQQQHSHHQTSKDWQEGLRALLPNVNVSFGALPNQSDGLHTPPANGRMFSSPPLNDHHHHNHHDRLPQRQHSGWNTMSPNDWTVLDPAIVGGQIADPSSSNRADSPSSWIKANLEQLTAETYNPNSLLSGFSGLTLGGQHHQQQQQHSGGLNNTLGNWGGQGGLLANTPPPGFSFNRGLAGMGTTPLQHPFQNLSGLGNSNDGPGQQLENEFRGLIRS